MHSVEEDGGGSFWWDYFFEPLLYIICLPAIILMWFLKLGAGDDDE